MLGRGPAAAAHPRREAHARQHRGAEAGAVPDQISSVPDLLCLGALRTLQHAAAWNVLTIIKQQGAFKRCGCLQAEQWGDLPLYALGASSGGAMVALLPFFVKLQVCK